MNSAEVFFSIPADKLPTVTLANSVTIDLPYVHFRRTPQEYILYVVLGGVMYLTEEDVDYTLLPGDFILLDPSRCHYGRQGSRCFYYYIHFTAENITEVLCTTEEYQEKLFRKRLESTAFPGEEMPESPDILLPKYFHLTGAPCQKLQHQAKELLLSYHQPIEFHRQISYCALLSFFITAQQLLADTTMESKDSARNPLSLEIIAYLKRYYAEKITGERIEYHFHKNFDYINRIFKKAIGNSIFQWLNNYRISEAKKLLQSNLYTHRQIAEKTGFSSEYYFSRAFKKHTGISPSEYRKQSGN